MLRQQLMVPRMAHAAFNHGLRVAGISHRCFSVGLMRLAKGVPDEVSKKYPNMTGEEYHKLKDEYFKKKQLYKRRTVANYATSLTLVFLSLAFLSVPLYRVICKRSGWYGQPITDKTKFTSDRMVPVDTDRRIRVQFTAETSSRLPWRFVPEQREVYVAPGETALAFYKAKNFSKHDITGMATYSVTPDNVAPYFNKIQCFCFEEQRLAAGEEVDMPLFFFIDPDFATDPSMRNIDDIVLHYTFFQATHNESQAQLIQEAKDKMSKANEQAAKSSTA